MYRAAPIVASLNSLRQMTVSCFKFDGSLDADRESSKLIAADRNFNDFGSLSGNRFANIPRIVESVVLGRSGFVRILGRDHTVLFHRIARDMVVK